MRRIREDHAARAVEWRQCLRGDRLLWCAGLVGADPRDIVRAGAACARLVLYLAPKGEERPLRAIEAAEAWADEPSPKLAAVARTTARAAWAYSMAAEGAAEGAAADAAGWAAEGASAWAVRAEAAVVAVVAVRAVEWTVEARAAEVWAGEKTEGVITEARVAMYRQCADEVRRYVPFPGGTVPQPWQRPCAGSLFEGVVDE